MKNLFDYATKELSQDAFLRWLFENYDCENEKVRRACQKLFNNFTSDELDFSKIENLTTMAQWKNIDVSIWFTILDEDYLIVIEDKTTTEEHKQLQNYNEKIQEHLDWLIKNNQRPIKKVYKVFYKTAEIGEEKKRIEEAQWLNILDIQKIYDLFKDVSNTGSEILDDYAEHIRDISATYYNFELVDFKTKWLYNNTIFQVYSQKKLKADNVGCYNGIYVYAGIQKKFQDFTMELLFEFRHWEIVAKIIYWRNRDSIDLSKLRNYMRAIDLSDCQPFPIGESYGNKRITRIIKKPEDIDFFNTYEQFDHWVCSCKAAFDKITSKVEKNPPTFF